MLSRSGVLDYSRVKTLKPRVAERVVQQVQTSRHSFSKLREEEELYHRTNIAKLSTGLPFIETEDNFRALIDQFIAHFQKSFLINGTEAGGPASASITSEIIQGLFNVKRVTGGFKGSLTYNPVSDIITGKKSPDDRACIVRYFLPCSYAEAYQISRDYIEAFFGDFVTLYEVGRLEDLNAELDNTWWYDLYALIYRVDAPTETTQVLRVSVDINKMHYYGLNLRDLAHKFRDNFDHFSNKLGFKDINLAVVPAPLDYGFIDVYVISAVNDELTSLDQEQVNSYLLNLISTNLKEHRGDLIAGISGVTGVGLDINSLDSTMFKVTPTTSKLVVSTDPKVTGYNLAKYSKGEYSLVKLAGNQAYLKKPETFLVEADKTRSGQVTPLPAWLIELSQKEWLTDGITGIDIVRVIADQAPLIILTVYDAHRYKVVFASARKVLSDPRRFRLSKDRRIPNARVRSFVINCLDNPLELWNRAKTYWTANDSPEKINPLKLVRHRVYGDVVYDLIGSNPNIDPDLIFITSVNTACILSIEVAYITAMILMESLLRDINPSSYRLILSRKMITGSVQQVDLSAGAALGLGPLSASFTNPLTASMNAALSEAYETTDTNTANVCVGAMNAVTQPPEVEKDLFGRPIVKGLGAFKMPKFEATDKRITGLLEVLNQMNQRIQAPTINFADIGLKKVSFVGLIEGFHLKKVSLKQIKSIVSARTVR
jgi:hypothetical protein